MVGKGAEGHLGGKTGLPAVAPGDRKSRRRVGTTQETTADCCLGRRLMGVHALIVPRFGRAAQLFHHLLPVELKESAFRIVAFFSI